MTENSNRGYEGDFYEWIYKNIELLKQRKFSELDIDVLIDELESMANRDRNELVSHFVILIAHLLKWQFQFKKFAEVWQHVGEYAAKSWQYTIIEQRYRIKDQLENSPSLEKHLNEAIIKAYSKAVSLAMKETGLVADTFPKECPYLLEQLLDDDFYPNLD
ncbi:MAG: hypothetical protein BWK79_06375 [Beggiatoa sp. IS2]|nr:MAG: hypothetical protein BWK79_06375 [Beggiatoa sp. IS2]